MKVIGITLRTHEIKERNEVRDSIDQKLISWVAKKNCMPILIPNNVEVFESMVGSLRFEGFILSGGNDSKERLELEHQVLRYSTENEIPLLGICHGFQAINTFYHGSHSVTPEHVNKVHEINIKSEYFGSSVVSVNSYHENVISQENLADSLEIIGVCNFDGTVEAAKHKTLNMIGIMWHPERQDSNENLDSEIMRYLFNV